MALSAGTRLGAYEIRSVLGVGGMGEVYRARDTKLGRDVALKVLPEAFTFDPDRLARFKREAHVLASLNHPSIAAIYGFEESNAMQALVLELVEGPTLADRIAQGRVPFEDALPIGKQIVEALEAAHEQGIIHRDLKPANIKVRPDGTVKVLDFGLAKALDPPAALEAKTSTDSPTISGPAVTKLGVILGTAAYMSPEQARGVGTDKRSDIWAFGCVLYEMLTARCPFTGDTVSDVVALVLTHEPDWTMLPESTPAAIRKLLRRCLEKNRRRRFADAADVRLEIEEALASPAGDTLAPAPTRSHHVALAMTAAGVALIAALLAWVLMRPLPQVSAHPIRFAIVPPPGQALTISQSVRDVVVSPNGTYVVYTGAKAQLMVRPFDRLDALPMAGVIGARAPFVSPDGRWIGFFTGTSGELKKVSIAGGLPITLCRTVGVPRGASWSADDTIVFATNEPTTGLFRIRADGGKPEVLTTPDSAKGMEEDHLFPSVLPHGRGVLFTIAGVSSNASNAQVAVLDSTTGQRKTLIRGGSQAEYVDTGHLIYAAAGSLRAIRFDLAKLELLSDPVPVVEPVMTLATGAANFSLARNGTLVYVIGAADNQSGGTRSLVWVTRDGREERIGAPVRNYLYPGISPDGTHVALAIDDQERDIWTWDFARETLTRLTFDPGRDWYPAWTPDGRHIIFMSARGGVPNVYGRLANGSGTAERLAPSSNVQFGSPSLTPDGTRLVFTQVVPGTGEDLMSLSIEPSTGRPAGEPHGEPLLQTDSAERNPQISPDGRWLAYESNESGQEEIYVRPFPKVGDGRWQVSSGGGTVPLWARSGRELFYRNGNSMMSASVRTTPTFSAGNPMKLFEGYTSGLGRTYDVSPDGRRFLMIKDNAASHQATTQASMVIVLNWFEELKARVPTR